jgi:hypothetical protein
LEKTIEDELLYPKGYVEKIREVCEELRMVMNGKNIRSEKKVEESAIIP